ncbi:MAG: hypothetical protein ACO22U_18890, partial [bacterium]
KPEEPGLTGKKKPVKPVKGKEKGAKRSLSRKVSGYVWCFGLKKKSETLKTIQRLVAAVERLLGKGLIR